jgi:hypothetical protein
MPGNAQIQLSVEARFQALGMDRRANGDWQGRTAMDGSRRSFLAWAGLVPTVLIAGRAAGAENATCYDPAALSLNLKNRRKSLGFVEQSSDPARRCGRCTFFQPKAGSCGECQLMVGAPVTAAGVCNSFAPRSG